MLIPSTLFETSTPDVKPAHKYSCLMAAVPYSVSGLVHSLAGSIDPQDLDPAEIKENPFYHITVLYGLHDDDPTLIQPHVKRACLCTLGSLSLFENERQDVLKISIDSPALHKLNSSLKNLPHTSTYPDYVPHLTVAYLKPKTGKQYLDAHNPLEGKQVLLTDYVFSNTESKKYWIYTALEPDSLYQSIAFGVDPVSVSEMLTAAAVGTMPRPMGMIRPVRPQTASAKKPSKSPLL